MATMRMGLQDCTVKYVDAAIGVPGDGSTPALALNTLPAANSMTNNTVYLCRRNHTTALTIPDGTNTTGSYIFLIGMPKSTDHMYLRAPAEAKSAWDADSDDYCKCNFATATSVFRFVPINDFGTHRIWYNRPSSGDCNFSYGTLQAEALYQSNDTAYHNGNYFMTNCKWTDNGVELDNESYTTNTSYQSGSIIFRYARNVTIKDCNIQYSGRYNGNTAHNSVIGYGGCIYIAFARNITIDNNVFYMSSFGGTSNTFMFLYATSNSGDRTEFTYTNNDMKLIGQNYSYTSFYAPIAINGLNMEVHNCTLTMHRFYNRPAVTGGWLSYGVQISRGSNDSGMGKWNITDITIDTGDIANFGGSLLYMYYYDAYSSYQSIPTCVVKRISAKCASTGFISSSGTAMMLYLGNNFVIDEVTAWHAYEQGLYFRDPFDSAYKKGAVIKNASIKGIIYCRYMNFLEVNDWYLNSPRTRNQNSYGVGVKLYQSYANIYIKTAQIDPTSEWESQTWHRYHGYAGHLIIDQIDVPYNLTMTYWDTTPQWDESILINNVDNITGKWYGTNRYYIGQSWNAYRTGGAAAAIKFNANAGFSDYHLFPLVLAPKPFRGLEWTPGSTGAATLTVYVAHKLFSPTYNLHNRFRIEIEVPYYDGANWHKETYLSETEGWWEDDGVSVWNNDTGLTPLKLILPFTVNSASQPITARMHFDWYDPTGYLYVDPLFVFAMS
jgi:hypothetical protein